MSHEWKVYDLTASLDDDLRFTLNVEPGSAGGVYRVEELLRREILRLAARDADHTRLLTELAGVLGLDVAAIKLGGLELGPCVLGALGRLVERALELEAQPRLDALLSSGEAPQAFRDYLYRELRAANAREDRLADRVKELEAEVERRAAENVEVQDRSRSAGSALLAIALPLKEIAIERDRYKAHCAAQQEALLRFVQWAEEGLPPEPERREWHAQAKDLLTHPTGVLAVAWQRAAMAEVREAANAERSRLESDLRMAIETGENLAVERDHWKAAALGKPVGRSEASASPTPADWPGGVPADPRPYFAEHPLTAEEEAPGSEKDEEG